MKALERLGILATLATGLFSSGFAQSDSHCHKTDLYTTVCEFSEGRAHEWTVIENDSWSKWYTASEWKAKKAKDARDARLQAKKHAEWQVRNDQLEAKAPLLKAHEPCENGGFIWVVKGELQDGVVTYMGSCHYSEAAMRVHKQAAK